MFEKAVGFFSPSRLFDPVGLSLRDSAKGFLIVFGVIFAIGVLVRVATIFTSLNPHLKRWLQKLSFILMFFGIFEVLYFLIREQGVAYISANIVFVLSFVLFAVWIVYQVGYRFFITYKRERKIYDIEQEHKQYLPKKKK